MKALYLENGKLDLRNIPKPERKSEESLVKVTVAGICNTDLELVKGYMDFTGVPGHEFVGIVEESDNPSLPGKRVVGEINAACGACEWCEKGLGRHCPNRTVLGILNHQGCFAEYLCLPDENLLVVPEEISDEAAVFTEPLAAAMEIQEQIAIQPDVSICVIGDGKLGILITLALSLASKNVTIIGKHSEKIALACANGAKGLNRNENIQQQFDIVVEASGSPSGWESAVNLVRPRGTIVLKSTYAEDLNFNPASLVINEITVVGSRCGLFAPALEVLQKGLVNPLPLIQQKLPFNDFQQAFEKAKTPGSMKILLALH